MPKSTAEERYRRDLALVMREAEAWGPIHDGVTAKVEFLIDGQHYDDGDSDEYNKRSDEVRWVGEEAFHRYRHEIGAVTEPGTLSARPVDTDGDPELADVVVRLMGSEIENPAKEFEDAWDDIVGCGSAAGYGVGWLDFLPNEGPWGEIIFAADDPRNFMCDRRVKSIHSPRCRFVIRKVRMTLGEAKRRVEKEGKRGWNKEAVAALRPDDGGCDFGGLKTVKQTTAEIRLKQNSAGVPLENEDDEEFTAYMIWYRTCDEVDEVEEDKDLEPSERYMRCTSCAYRSETQGSLNSRLPEPQELPDKLPGGCPECIDKADAEMHGDMVRVDVKEDRAEMLAYPDGRLAIIAPFALPGKELHLYEGDWPFKMRSFPCTFLPRFRHPFRIVGPSIADLAWWNQIATDMVMRLALERLLQTAPFWMFPIDGLEDARGNRFEGTNENGWTAYYTGPNMPAVSMVGGETGLPAAWSPIYQSARQSLTGHTGIADFSLSEGQSRDIPASSVSQQIKQEEIPVAHYKRRYQRQRGLLLGVYYDIMREVYPAERLYRLLGNDASEAVQALAASDLPNFDFHFDSTPDMRPQDEATARAAEALANYIEQRPWFVDIFATVNRISPSLVRKAKEAWRKQQEEMAQAQAEAAANAAPAMPQGAPMGVQQEKPSAMMERMMAGIGRG